MLAYQLSCDCEEFVLAYQLSCDCEEFVLAYQLSCDCDLVCAGISIVM